MIRGRVIAMDTGAPIPQADVSVSGGGPRATYMTQTDDNGRFELSGVAIGRYSLTAVKEGYLRGGSGQGAGPTRGKTVTITTAEARIDIDLAIPRAGVLSGRVTDERGHPMSKVLMSALRVEYTQGRRRLVPTNSGIATDDRGEARIFGLTPGRYYVMASPFNKPYTGRPSDKPPLGYGATFYPAATSVTDAQPLAVAIGGTTEFQIALRAVALADVQGVALGADGGPMAGGVVHAQLANAGNLVAAQGTSIRPDGSFLIRSLAPGTYWLQAKHGPRAPQDTAPSTAIATVTVDGLPVKDVLLEPQTMVAVSGRIIVDAALKKTIAAGTLTVGATPATDRRTVGGQRPGVVKSDWTFEFQTWPGAGFVRVAPLKGMTVKAVRLDGIDVTDTGIEFRPGQNVGGLEIELTDRSALVSGTVVDRSGATVDEYSVVLFSQNRGHWTASSGRYVAMGRPDQNGRFLVSTLPEGKYYAAALTGLDNDWADPAVLERLIAQATACVLKDGTTTTLTLKPISPPDVR